MRRKTLQRFCGVCPANSRVQNRGLLAGFAAVLVMAAFTFVLTACSTGGGGGDSPNAPITYRNTTQKVELKIARTESELDRAITPQTLDWYRLKHNNVEISRGTIAVNGANWTFTQSRGKVTSTITAALSGGVLTLSTVSYQDNGTQTIPGCQLTADSGRTWPAALAGRWAPDFESGWELIFGKITGVSNTDYDGVVDGSSPSYFLDLVSVTGNSCTVKMREIQWAEQGGSATVIGNAGDCTFTAVVNGNTLTISGSTKATVIKNGTYSKQQTGASWPEELRGNWTLTGQTFFLSFEQGRELFGEYYDGIVDDAGLMHGINLVSVNGSSYSINWKEIDEDTGAVNNIGDCTFTAVVSGDTLTISGSTTSSGLPLIVDGVYTR